MRAFLFAISRTLWGIYLILTSIYCLLAFLPYTYVALIKEPPYAWVPWFAQHQTVLYFLALALLLLADSQRRKRRGPSWVHAGLALGGSYLLFRPFLPTLEASWPAYAWSLASLLPLAAISMLDWRRCWPCAEDEEAIPPLLSYSVGIGIAVSVALLFAVAAGLHTYTEAGSIQGNTAGLELSAWSVVSHVLLAIVVVSLLNMCRLISRRSRRPTSLHHALIALLSFTVLSAMIARLLHGSLGFEGWAAFMYAASLAATLTLWAGSLVLTSPNRPKANPIPSRASRFLLWTMILALSLFAVVLPTMIAGSDWDGVLESSFTLFFWIAIGSCLYTLWGRRKNYSWVNILAIALLSCVAYEGLQETAILWARPLGPTDDDIAHAMENYAVQNASFRLVHQLLSNRRQEACGDLCRILRENTNIRDAAVKSDLQLVDSLAPSSGERPNIFLFVIDSLRPDYLGAYNPKVDFTPKLDAFARDSAVLHRVYTQYAGTSLSEPVIWAGTLLLHAHYLQPFSRVNSLEKLARVDSYRMAVSYDEILRQLLSPSDDLVKLDTDKKLWNQLEVCSTIRQLEPMLQNGLADRQPILFYTQPKNVHQFAHNDLPLPSQDNWQNRPGFNNRIAHEVHQVDGCLGGFFSFLKARGLYDNSIIILTSDHGDATGEFGRSSHSLSIYPEVMHVPLIVHLPPAMRHLHYDDGHLSALTDLTPSLYYLLGHRSIRSNPLFGHPLFVETQAELEASARSELFLASDERPAYGLLMENGRFLYTTYDSPPQSFLFNLSCDPNALHNLLTPALKTEYDQQIIHHLQAVAEFYGYKPGVGSLLAATR